MRWSVTGSQFFRLEAADIPVGIPVVPSELSFSKVFCWEDLPVSFRQRVEASSSRLDWGSARRFAKGWRLWVGLRNGEVAALGWWCNAQQASADYFFVPEEGGLLNLAMMLPEFRGQYLQLLLRRSLLQERVRHGVQAFYVHCRDYNLPSLRTTERLGFRQIGYGIAWRVTGWQVWHLDPPGGRSVSR